MLGDGDDAGGVDVSEGAEAGVDVGDGFSFCQGKIAIRPTINRGLVKGLAWDSKNTYVSTAHLVLTWFSHTQFSHNSGPFQTHPKKMSFEGTFL